VNIAKFGAFVSIMPGRDGLLHISKMAPLNGGKRIGQVEDVLELGQTIEVKVDDIDPQGKVSLSLVGDFPESEEGDARPPRSRDNDRGDRGDRGGRDRDRGPRERTPRENAPRENAPRESASTRPTASSSSFEAAFEAELADEIGDLGPGGPAFVDGDSSRRSPRPRRR
jgi:polyribonucleotide nucleotidyltransferase